MRGHQGERISPRAQDQPTSDRVEEGGAQVNHLEENSFTGGAMNPPLKGAEV